LFSVAATYNRRTMFTAEGGLSDSSGCEIIIIRSQVPVQIRVVYVSAASIAQREAQASSAAQSETLFDGHEDGTAGPEMPPSAKQLRDEANMRTRTNQGLAIVQERKERLLSPHDRQSGPMIQEFQQQAMSHRFRVFSLREEVQQALVFLLFQSQ
jgi:hypothetical protein